MDTFYTDPGPSPSFEPTEHDVSYQLAGGPLDGALLCASVELHREHVQVRVRSAGAEHVYVGFTTSGRLEYTREPWGLGYAWRPVRWIYVDKQTYVFSDDRPELPAEAVR